MEILLIALIPAICIFVVSAGTNSKFWTTIAAIVAAAVGIFLGNPFYILIDLASVAVVYWLSMSAILEQSTPKVVIPKAKPATNKDDYSGLILGALGVLGYVGYQILSSGPTVSSTPAPSPPNLRQQNAVVPIQPPFQSAPVNATPQPKRPAIQVPKPTVQKCLEIQSEEKMVACLERLR